MADLCLSTVILYARDPERSAAFYAEHFGLKVAARDAGMVELRGPHGAGLLLHPAAKSARLGQAGIKLSFAVEDVAGFIARAAELGLIFGPIHQAAGYEFANAKDPDGHHLCVSSRSFRAHA
jgi:catechol 2,3-dioxygenase-like lactoylglutathione lyase family enzyme